MASNFRLSLKMAISVFLIFILVGCVGYQNVRTFERVNGELIVTKQVKAYIFGTSGQSVHDKDIQIEKKDAVDRTVDLLQSGLSAGKEILSSAQSKVSA